MISESYNWLYWGVILMIGLPVLVVLFNELADALARHGSSHFRKPLDITRNSCLLLLFLVILLRQVVGLPADHMAVKVVDTTFWIAIINAVVAFFNAIVFQPGATDWRARAPKLLIDLGRLFMVMLGAALVVSHVWSVDLRGVLAALGVGSLVIGLALQDTLGNVFSGLAMISARQFKIGDWIRVGDVEGQVRSLNWRTVSVTTLTGDIVVIPNSMIARDRLRVYGADQGWMRILIDFKIAYEHPPERVQDMLLKAAAATKEVLADPKPTVRLISFEDFAILYRVSVCIRDYRLVVPIRSEYQANVWYLAERAGIAFPARYNHRYELPKQFVRSSSRSPEEIAGLLQRLGTLRPSPEALAMLSANARVELYRSGETLLTKGRRGTSAFVVVSGAAQAMDLVDGAEAVVDAYATGDLILFKAFLRGGGAPYGVRAQTDIETIAVPIEDLENALARDAELAHEMEQQFTMREEAHSRSLAKGRSGRPNGKAADGDRVQILKDMFRV